MTLLYRRYAFGPRAFGKVSVLLAKYVKKDTDRECNY